MTEVQFAYGLIREIDRLAASLPATDSPVYTIESVMGSQVQLDAEIVGNWKYGVMEIQTGDARLMRAVVIDTDGHMLTLLSGFNIRLGLKPGDTIKLTGGPLQKAKTYMGDPLTIAKDIKDGIKFFVTLQPAGGTIGFRGMPGRREGLDAAKLDYGMTMTCETPHITGAGGEASVFRAEVDLPTLVHQVVGILFRYCIDSKSRTLLNGEVAYDYFLFERAGASILKAAQIEFDVGAI